MGSCVDGVNGNILLSLPKGHWTSYLTSCLMVVTLIGSFPLCMIPIHEVVEHYSKPTITNKYFILNKECWTVRSIEIIVISAIAYLMGLSWGTLAGCFIGPYVLGLIWKKTTKSAVWVSMITSLALTLVLIFVFGYIRSDYSSSFGIILQMGINCSPIIGVICMASSMILTFVISLFTKQLESSVVDKAFNDVENCQTA